MVSDVYSTLKKENHPPLTKRQQQQQQNTQKTKTQKTKPQSHKQPDASEEAGILIY